MACPVDFSIRLVELRSPFTKADRTLCSLYTELTSPGRSACGVEWLRAHEPTPTPSISKVARRLAPEYCYLMAFTIRSRRVGHVHFVLLM